MANLNEDVLRHIFGYLKTPLEWVQVSQVCQLWKTAAQSQWKKIRIIRYYETSFPSPLDANTDSVISAKDAKLMINYSAPSVQIIEQVSHSTGNGIVVQFNSFSYKVEEFESDFVMELLVEGATELMNITLNRPPKLEIWPALIENNKLHSVHFLKCDDFYKNVRTDKIKHLNVNFDVSEGIESFQGHFPDLASLHLYLYSKTQIEPEELLLPVLPFTLGLRDLRLKIHESITFLEESLFEIAKLSELEYLMLDCDYNILLDPLIPRLVTGCPKLRSIDIKGSCELLRGPGLWLTLPCLKRLSIPYVDTLEFPNLPKDINLEELCIEEVGDDLITRSVCIAIEKMPKLKVLEIKYFQFEDDVEELIFEIARVVLSQNRNFVFDTADFNDRHFIMVKNLAKPTQFEGLTFSSCWYITIDFIERLKTFVHENFGNNFAIFP